MPDNQEATSGLKDIYPKEGYKLEVQANEYEFETFYTQSHPTGSKNLALDEDHTQGYYIFSHNIKITNPWTCFLMTRNIENESDSSVWMWTKEGRQKVQIQIEHKPTYTDPYRMIGLKPANQIFDLNRPNESNQIKKGVVGGETLPPAGQQQEAGKSQQPEEGKNQQQEEEGKSEQQEGVPQVPDQELQLIQTKSTFSTAVTVRYLQLVNLSQFHVHAKVTFFYKASQQPFNQPHYASPFSILLKPSGKETVTIFHKNVPELPWDDYEWKVDLHTYHQYDKVSLWPVWSIAGEAEPKKDMKQCEKKDTEPEPAGSKPAEQQEVSEPSHL